MPTPLRWLRLRPQELALIAITVVWGGTFLAVHVAMQHSGPWFFVGLRFLVAGLISILIFRASLRGMRWRDIGAGTSIGASRPCPSLAGERLPAAALAGGMLVVLGILASELRIVMRRQPRDGD